MIYGPEWPVIKDLKEGGHGIFESNFLVLSGETR
jgi:hypothetical protein